MDSLYGRRTNSNKLSLSTNTSPSIGSFGDAPAASPSTTRNTTLPRRFGGDSSSHGGKANPFNTATTPGGSRIMSPGGPASSAFGLGSGAFSSFGSSAKTPKSPGNPFDVGFKSATSGTSAPAAAGEKSSAATPRPAAVGGAAAPGAAGTAAADAAPPADKNQRYLLRNEWVFWFRPPISKANGYIEYEKTLHPVATVSSVEDFFAVYTHLKRPSTLPLVADYHFFRNGIRPIWEDAENRKGGKWIVRLKKGVADRYWEDLLFAIIGDQFGDASDEVCGAVLSVRNGEDILSVWTRTDGSRVLKIRETMRRALGFPLETKMDWKSHDSSIQQRSAIEESRRDKSNQHHNSGGTNNQHHNNHHNNQHHNNHHNHNHNNYNQHQHQHQNHQSDRRSGKLPYSARASATTSGGGGDDQQLHAHGTP
ncbi:translation initiation factor 4E [Sporothrix brasiliensis 5110]|uniref:Translation initiation factor 4E n=1 Tax=Sporothrix brasiliensis 5110 TaxID=1398154 RepID=A0A0C2EQ14_9PEZI|nr:translation initiation factor 4E [Sporothrix brasiliensis 5110]KIH88404.1 translation initiation factor 4E [Sporothrix brasiliensis 5110]